MMDFSWEKVCSIDLEEISQTSFFNGIKVWIERPHILNRKLSTVEILNSWTLQHPKCITSKFLDETLREGNFTYDAITEVLENKFSFENIICGQQEIDKSNTITIMIRKLLPRNFEKFTAVLEIAVVDNAFGCVNFYPKKEDVLGSKITVPFAYRIRLSDNSLFLESYNCRNEMSSTQGVSEEWLKESVLPKIVKWSLSLPSCSVSSLNLVCSKSYAQNYFNLKSKYGKNLVKIWPECTDPLKYVYEDIAIAAYLITYWETESRILNLKEKQSFVDLGCGNGLLVHLLSEEGYPGVGYDVRKRKIWDLYGSGTNLMEKSIEPSADLRFSQYDWIIGNHSDELTPWIPVIAARSSYKMRVFLLPCCFHTFNGKYERKDAGITQYQSYLNFIRKLCSTMGFVVQQDKLRIPSTKRICFVCASRNYKQDEENIIEEARVEFIQLNSRKIVDKSTNCLENPKKFRKVNHNASNSCLFDFIPRNSVENVRNCSQLDKSFLDETVIAVMRILLKTENYVELEGFNNNILWNAGETISIEDIVKSFDSKALKNMKKQCGGFQTFLRNYKSIFLVQKGKVQLRIPTSNDDWKLSLKKRTTVKPEQLCKKKCYFHYHHPQGCPLPANTCTFSHEIE